MMEASSPCFAVLLPEERRPKAESTIPPILTGDMASVRSITAVEGTPGDTVPGSVADNMVIVGHSVGAGNKVAHPADKLLVLVVGVDNRVAHSADKLLVTAKRFEDP